MEFGDFVYLVPQVMSLTPPTSNRIGRVGLREVLFLCQKTLQPAFLLDRILDFLEKLFLD